MRNIFFLSFLVVSLVAKAQYEIQPSSELDKPLYLKSYIPSSSQNTILKSYGSKWYNTYEDLVDAGELIGSTEDNPFWGMVLFPDSNMIIGFTSPSNEPIYAYTHAAAEVVNPYFIPNGWLEYQSGEVIVDSVEIWYSYERNTDPSIVDTLFVEYLSNRDSIITFTKTIGLSNFLYSSALITYDPNKNSPKSYQIQRVDTILLTDGYQLQGGGIGVLGLDVSDTINEFENYGVYIKFQPGYTWNTAGEDTITKYNTFSMISREQFSEKSPLPLWDINSSISSYVIPTGIRYNQAGGNNGVVWPTTAFGDIYPYEHHYVWFKFESNFLSVEDLNGNLAKLELFPNPSNFRLSVKYSLIENQDFNMGKIMDATGRMLSEFQFDAHKGDHQLEINTSSFTSGIYYIQFNNTSVPFVVNR